MKHTVRHFVVIDSIHGPFVIDRHSTRQADALLETGRPHNQGELDTIMQVIDQLPDGALAVDGGANAGLVCVPIAQRLRDRGGHVHAFEPRRTLFHALGGTVALNQLDNLHLLNMGLASRNGTMTVPDVDGGHPAGAEPAARVDAHAADGTPAPTVRLDSLGLPRLDFLKLDIDGMEVDALHGARLLIETHLPWCWIACRNADDARVIDTFAGLDYTFYRFDGPNLLCVPNPRWDRQRLFISGEPVGRVSARADDDANAAVSAEADDAPETHWNRALDHESRCEWGHAIARWLCARGRGLDDDAIAFQLASCYGFAGAPDAGLAALERIGEPAALPDALRGRVELARSALLLRAGRRDEAARATIASENVLTAARFGLPTERLYDGQPLHGKRLLVISYGGVGDQLQYARYLHALDALDGVAVTVIVPAALADLMRHTFPRIEVVAAHGAWVDTSQIAHDYWCSFLVLAAQFGYAPAPAGAPAAYLSCPPERAAAWRERVARDGNAPGTRRIGLNWRGRDESDARFLRAASLRDLAPLARLRGHAAYCINRDIAAQSEPSDLPVTFPHHAIGDFSDLAALMLAMDAVVTTCTAHIHLAGALGVPAVLLLSPKADARWETGSRTALYPGIRIVRAAHPGRWDDTADRALALVLGGFGKD
ncbi:MULTISPECIES: FkbM family methyltransferase [unclassified Burkholderia]|uniref:FkbM family methyltransferase n=1 Tax=unclassified Burkholderia TaxID=2613784 RepID=UPI000F5A64EE|nr:MULTISPECIES: FkbM family methyltransferase [unclassified Burkholderia]RQS23604.1 FkbM family methyltransferase [Burkholderia sp. Bp8995]RQS42265.1 FkbM family methyltransferase [Burkholderia sp. Bp8989]RQS43067.1 FkbM family methyltransferase [Burkholderia sp. Bp8990]RQS55100.1 FkbM family methyltransferase [Burkholderia sp. Bp8984]RQZ34066.1 FkbM family methyltransferase [Burkholderia sp. Bp9090]